MGTSINAITAKKKVFMIMPFTDEFFEVFEMLKRTFDNDFEFSHAGAEGNPQNILKDIFPPIYHADVVIADLTGQNPNVMYELGVAHTFNKKTLIITQDKIANLPFDLKQYRTQDYSTHFLKFDNLVNFIRKNLYGAIDYSAVFSNPVRDSFSPDEIKEIKIFVEKTITHLENDYEKGFLDYMVSIETEAISFTQELEQVTEEMAVMANGMTQCISEIERVKKGGGMGNTSFVQKQVKRAAGFVDDFGKKLRNHNINFNANWDKIERDIIGLMENSSVSINENKESLKSFFNVLNTLKIESKESSESLQGLKVAMNGNIGIEWSLNQAIKLLDIDFGNFIAFISRMNLGIDKILRKGILLIG